MNAFFASIEQLDFPRLRNQPVGVTNGKQGTCIITCSYEARRFGIKTGMRLREARQLCPQLIQRPARPQRYSQISKAIMAGLQDVTPDVEVFSVDEAFLDVTACQRLYGTPIRIGHLVKQKIWTVSRLPCSIGISGDKTTAKFAAKLQKPDGFTVIPPWEARQYLQSVPVTQLCGIANGIGDFLAKYGVHVCGDMAKLPISVLAKRFGNLGRRIWFMCQGMDPLPLQSQVSAPKSMGHGKVMPPNTKQLTVILTYLLHMSEKLAARLRRHQMQAQIFFIGVRLTDVGWVGAKQRLAFASHDGSQIYQLGKIFLTEHWQGEGVNQIQVTALDPKPMALQGDFFVEHDPKRDDLYRTLDAINDRFGEFAILPARLLQRSTMPNVISPAWKPDGHRQTIDI